MLMVKLYKEMFFFSFMTQKIYISFEGLFDHFQENVVVEALRKSDVIVLVVVQTGEL